MTGAKKTEIKESVVADLVTPTPSTKSFSVSDIDSINVAVSLNGLDTKGSFSSVIDAYEKMRTWHRQIVKGKDDPYRINYAVRLGFVNKDWKDVVIKDDYIVTKRELDFSDFVSWIAQHIRDSYSLKPFVTNSPYLEVHISWNVWRGYFHIIRRRRDILIDHAHDILETSWNTRALIMLKLMGYEWTFSYRSRQGESHYYCGSPQSIHQEITRLATNAYSLATANSLLSQSQALEALTQFYKKYPDLKTTLVANHHVVEDIIQSSSPQFNKELRESALNLLYMIPPEETLSSMEKIYADLLLQMDQWHKAIETNKIIVENSKKKSEQSNGS